MKDAILKIIKEVESNNPFEVTNTDVNTYYAWKEACDAMRIKLHDYDPWISVEDRLPEDDQRVMIGGNIFCTYTSLSYYFGKRGKGFVDGQDEQPTICYPKYWMPESDLPQPPKAKL